MDASAAWPALDPAAWAPTKRSLHLYAQMLGKLRLALSPHQPNFTYTSLQVTPRGISTGPIPVGLRLVDVSIDLFESVIAVDPGDGRRERIALSGGRTVAAVFAELLGALDRFDVPVSLSPVPQEVADVTPLDRDTRPAAFEPLDARRWLAIVTATCAVFNRWRSHFFGRASAGLWWGGFDYSLTLFSGRHVPAPDDRGYLIKYDLDAEMMNVGFYPGDDQNPPNFYGYIYPQPPACGAVAMAPREAAWSDALGEWILPYDAVRGAADPEATLRAFLDAVYRTCGAAAGWDHAALTYVPPPLRRGR